MYDFEIKKENLHVRLIADGTNFPVDAIIWTLMIPGSSMPRPKLDLNVFISFSEDLYKNLLFCMIDIIKHECNRIAWKFRISSL